jgi:hypothetical protein
MAAVVEAGANLRYLAGTHGSFPEFDMMVGVLVTTMIDDKFLPSAYT